MLSIAESAAHPHHTQRGTFLTAPDGSLQPGIAPRFSATRAGAPGPAPLTGAHTREVLTGIGLTEAELDDLVVQGAISPKA